MLNRKKRKAHKEVEGELWNVQIRRVVGVEDRAEAGADRLH